MPPEDEVQATLDRLNTELPEIMKKNTILCRESAPLFSPFEALLPNELSLSQVLGYLFDESAGHGQGSLFLNQFINLIHCPCVTFELARVTSEYPITTEKERIRFIDLVIVLRSGNGEYWVGIENKPWAAEQKDQCEDYAKALHRSSHGAWTLVFLTNDGRLPSSGGEYKDQIKGVRYDDLAMAFQTSCNRVQQFLCDFQRYVRERINGDFAFTDPNEVEMIDLFLRPENIDATVEIVANVQSIRRRIFGRFREAILAKVRATFGDTWDAELMLDGKPVADLDTQWAGLYFFKPAWKALYAIGFSNRSADARAVIFGIFYWGRELNVKIGSGRLHRDLADAFKTGRSTACWDWFNDLRHLCRPDYQNWHDPEVIRRMALDGGKRMVEDLFPLLEATIKLAEKEIDRALGSSQ